MKTKGALLWEPGTNSGWSVEEIEIDDPNHNEVLVKLAATGICHSDDHVDTGDIPLDWAPLLGGHEGAGVVEKVGPGVTDLEVGDHVVFSFLPACGKCIPCVAGDQNLCDLGAGVLGGVTLDGDHRVHARGKGVGAMCFLGTFSPYVVAPLNSVIKIDKSIPLDKAALVGCGVPTGWGSAVYAAETQIGDTVVVFGVGGVGMNAVQGAKFAGATQIVAVDPVASKREKALEFGATHTATDADEALAIVEDITNGRLADRAIFTVGVGDGKLIQGMNALVRKGGVMVCTSAAPALQTEISINLLELTMSGKRFQGALFGSCAPRNDIPMLLDLYMRGDLKLDELVTTRYKLEDINQAVADLREGKNIRGLIVYDE
ncbi:NDMA-dependent alcohol dehydrogenase [Gordonia sp. zg691]|uniref:alcohol dehydrogenase n=1 Tax=Gordonia jinghuaiqii TaxID=2758710 RepID=A0A7D7LW09_9ACTN|nr:NDMA-dependent alcohol dehydrogenase [Gordonia jinghuaiqii]MBD0860478.1 NDMA-dependent alcohol dehydrogenase [Gordonia jinghuaiqii]MCR5978253.1 NDMA-dependent alcohol dehydrogenase [Gordonia jinghuaiqii]QMT01299.1 NDMA-dependent alcohol dehydrogenase [Gordonia jinghuaiqii]